MPRVYISANTQRAVIERAQGRCEYCQSRADYTTEPFAVEHIMPVSRGGTSELDNLTFPCSGCNGYKYNLGALDTRQDADCFAAATRGRSKTLPSCISTSTWSWPIRRLMHIGTFERAALTGDGYGH